MRVELVFFVDAVGLGVLLSARILFCAEAYLADSSARKHVDNGAKVGNP